jgi:uncharacterized phage-like protein YoqJ
MTTAVTGHRPDKLGGYSRELDNALSAFAMGVLTQRRPSSVLSGMALGWDQSVAIAAVRLGIPFGAIIPFEGQENRWPKAAQETYRRLVNAASFVHVVCERWQVEDGGASWALQERNRWMIDNTLDVIALWNGDRSGGTYNCIQYAKEGRREIANVWLQWEDWWESGAYLI